MIDSDNTQEKIDVNNNNNIMQDNNNNYARKR